MMVSHTLANTKKYVPGVEVGCDDPAAKAPTAMDVEGSGSLSTLKINRSALLRTARLLMRGEVLVADSAFSAPGKQ